jgi:hypothetical protein
MELSQGSPGSASPLSAPFPGTSPLTSDGSSVVFSSPLCEAVSSLGLGRGAGGAAGRSGVVLKLLANIPDESLPSVRIATAICPGCGPRCPRLALTDARNRSHLPAQTALIQARTHTENRTESCRATVK